MHLRGIELWSSGSAASALKHRAITPAPPQLSFKERLFYLGPWIGQFVTVTYTYTLPILRTGFPLNQLEQGCWHSLQGPDPIYHCVGHDNISILWAGHTRHDCRQSETATVGQACDWPVLLQVKSSLCTKHGPKLLPCSQVLLAPTQRVLSCGIEGIEASSSWD